jgi:hypothetical protein
MRDDLSPLPSQRVRRSVWDPETSAQGRVHVPVSNVGDWDGQHNRWTYAQATQPLDTSTSNKNDGHTHV